MLHLVKCHHFISIYRNIQPLESIQTLKSMIQLNMFVFSQIICFGPILSLNERTTFKFVYLLSEETPCVVKKTIVAWAVWQTGLSLSNQPTVDIPPKSLKCSISTPSDPGSASYHRIFPSWEHLKSEICIIIGLVYLI